MLAVNFPACSVQSLSRVQPFVTLLTAARQASLSINHPWRLLKLMSIKSVMPSNYFILCCPLLLLPSIFPTIRVFSNESVLHIRWPKYWSFSFSISPSNEYSGWIFFRIDWFDLLAVQGTLRSLLQHHSSKALVLWLSSSFVVQFSYQIMTIEKKNLFFYIVKDHSFDCYYAILIFFINSFYCADIYSPYSNFDESFYHK